MLISFEMCIRDSYNHSCTGSNSRSWLLIMTQRSQHCLNVLQRKRRWQNDNKEERSGSTRNKTADHLAKRAWSMCALAILCRDCSSLLSSSFLYVSFVEKATFEFRKRRDRPNTPPHYTIRNCVHAMVAYFLRKQRQANNRLVGVLKFSTQDSSSCSRAQRTSKPQDVAW